MAKIVMTVGLPASGKSTWAKREVLNGGGKVKRVNKDDLREMIDGGVWSPLNEKFILHWRDEIIKGYLYDDNVVIVDDTNLNPRHTVTLRAMAEVYKAELEIKDFTHVPLEICLERDALRPKPVGDRIIKDMHAQLVAKV